MKNVIIIIIIIVVLGLVAWLIFGNDQEEVNDNTTSQTNTTTSLSPVDSNGDASVVDYAIEMDEYSYSPAVIQIESGETIQIKLTNKGRMLHDFVIDELDVNSGLLSSGKEKIITITVNSTGSYSFY